MPQPSSHCNLQILESLPYLNAVIREGLRITHPVTHRISRSFPDKNLIYKDVVIPAGTIVHMTALLIHENEEVFPDAKVFRPERWLGEEKLQRYLVPFSRGSRGCLGINLAWTELYMIIAKVFRRFNFDTREVSRERDIDAVKDEIMGVARADTKGIIVKVMENDR